MNRTDYVSLAVVIVTGLVLRACLRAWVNLPNRDEYPRDGEHAPKTIYENRSRR